MMIFKKSIPRRAFLRGAGAALALPLLDSMVPAMALPVEEAVANPTLRLSFVYVPNGILMDRWTPATEGTVFDLPPTLQAFAPFRDQMLVLSGLAQNNGLALEGEGSGEHARASAVWLTSAHPKKTEGADLRAGVSVDQIIAREYGKQTQLASLELALEPTDTVGTCDTGYSCAYTNTLCWRTPEVPMPMENHPRAVFERLFGDSESTDPASRLARTREDRSILDLVLLDIKRLLDGVGPQDRGKLNEYMDAIRDVERRIQLAEAQSTRELPSVERPKDIPGTYEEHFRIMMDLQVLAFQTDMTRVSTFMTGREQSTRVYRELGFADPYHSLSHHQNDPEKIAKIFQIDLLHSKVMADYLDKLRTTPDGEGTLLDHSMVIYGSALSDGNMHYHNDLPTLVMGGGAGRIKGGRHIRYPKDTPMANLFLTVMDQFGISMDSFGDSTGRLAI